MPKEPEMKTSNLIQYDDDKGNPYLGWMEGKVDSIVNKNTMMVLIEWNEKRLLMVMT